MSLGPPPINSSFYLLEQFAWCQVHFVFMHELLREQTKLGYAAAYTEATDVVAALQKGDQPLALGANPGEVNWPTMICAANAYAHMDTSTRAKARRNLAEGQPIFSVDMIDDPDLCNLRVLEDSEYSPQPWCIEKDAASAFEMGVSSMAWTFGLIFAFRGLTARL